MHAPSIKRTNIIPPKEHSESPYDHFDGYTGPAILVIGEDEVSVSVALRGFFHPGNGFYQWYGRIAGNERLTEVLGQKRAKAALLATSHGEADCTLSDPDAWGRFRVTGASRPPFPTITDIDDE
jgi:hypothetical protein